MTERDMDTDASQDHEQVILVHGTFASSSDDCGKGWWQVGSQAYNELKKRLPQRVSLASTGNVFRWSGDNTERARSKAAAELLKFLKPLEESGQRYHLVGHSHGGSVIWAALRLATARKKPLDHLGSWSTVGTPYLQHQSRSPWNAISIAYMWLAAALLYPAGRAFWTLATLPYDVATGALDGGIIIKPDNEVRPVVALIRTPILKAVELMGVTKTPVEGGMRLGSFDPASGDSMGLFLIGTVEGWIIIGAILLFGYVTLLLGCCFLSPVSEGLRIGWEKRLEEQAFEQYSARWLGIWTPDDEAINGLRATMELSASFVGEFSLRERIFVSDLISVPSRPLFRLVAPVYNRLLRPALDSKIRDIVVKTAQGNDRPAAHVVAVSPHPILPPPASSVPPLPEQLSASICDRANHHASDLGPKLRQLLTQPSLKAGLDGFSQTLSGRELVHTSYFDHPEVLELLSLNIGWAIGSSQPRRSSTPTEITQWFLDFKQLQGAEIPEHPVAQRPNVKNTKRPRDKRKAA